MSIRMNDMSKPVVHAGSQAQNMGDDEGASLLDLLKALSEAKWVFLLIAVLGTAMALVYALNVQRFYSATTVIMPPQQQQSSAASALAQLGALSGMVGAGGNKSPDELYMALFKSRSLQDALIKRFKLQSRYETKAMTDARMVLGYRVALSSDKKAGLISVSVDDPDAEFAAALANGHVDELRKLLSTLAVTEAQQRRVFFEQQLSKTQDALSAAELNFRKLQTQSGMVVTQSLADAGVRAAVELRAQIATREVQLQALSRFATPANPAALQMAAELAALRQQLNKVEGGSGVQGAVDDRGLAAVKAFRDMKVQEAELEALFKQYELAKMDESREGPLLQQVDVAVAPEFPAKPKRSNIVIAGAIVSVIVGAIVAIARTFSRRKKSTSVKP